MWQGDSLCVEVPYSDPGEDNRSVTTSYYGHAECFQVSHAMHFRLPDLWRALLCVRSSRWRVFLILRGQQHGTICDIETRVKQPGSPPLPNTRALLGSLDLALALLVRRVDGPDIIKRTISPRGWIDNSKKTLCAPKASLRLQSAGQCYSQVQLQGG